MTTLKCTHPGCGDPVDVPDHFQGVLLDRLARAAVCDEHTPDDEPMQRDDQAPTVMSTWQSRVPSEIARFYGGAPTLSDLPETLIGLSALRCIAEAWPGRWTHPGSGNPINAIVFSGVSGSLKTTTAYALALDMMRRMDRPDLHHAKVHIATEGDLLGDQYNHRGFPTPAHPDRDVRSADVVLVDDVGTARFNSGENRTNAWWTLMNAVSTRGKFLILTTNLDERHLWDHIGAAAFSRLVGMWGRPIPGGFVAPTSNNPADNGYWPTPVGFGITPTLDDHRMLGTQDIR